MSLTTQDILHFFDQKCFWWCLNVGQDFSSITLSDALEARIGTSVLTSEDFMSFMVPESIHHFMTYTQSLLEGKEDKYQFLLGLNIDGELLWLVNDVHHAQRNDRQLVCASCVDITSMYNMEEKLIASHSNLIVQQLQHKKERSQAEHELLCAQYKRQTKFLAMLSHELRTPLMGVNSLLTAAKIDNEQGLPIDEQLRIIKVTIDQLNFLINDILTYSQTESEQIQINPSRFSVDEMAEYITHLTKALANDKGVTVSVAKKTQSASFYGDLLRISQILVNLIINAIKFTEEGGVFVEIEETSIGLSFSITDSGEGMDDAQLNDIFEPFKQLDSKGSRQYVGSGLGLSIVKRLVDVLGGSIEVESSKGLGTKFTIELPVDVERCSTKSAKQLEMPEKGEDKKQRLIDLSEPLSVLIADDSAINRKVLELFLHEINCVVEHAENGEQAWQKFLEKDFDVVFLDIQMPVMDGMEVCNKIRALDKGLKPKLKGVYALTAAHTEDEIRDMGIDVDKELFDNWIEKPVSQDKVFGALYQELFSREELAKSKLMDLVPVSLVHLLPQFIESTTQDLKKLKALWAEREERSFKKVCHSLKGNLMLFEVTEMLAVIKDIEPLSFDKDGEQLESLLLKIDKIYRSLY